MRKSKTYINLLIAGGITIFGMPKLSAQLIPVYSQFFGNMMMVNPAAAGTDTVVHISSIYRRQWLSIPGAPATANVALSIPGKNKFGYGLQFYSDKLGVESNNSIEAMLSYNAQLSARTSLALGFQFGYKFYSANRSSVDVVDQNDPGFQSNLNFALPVAGFGLYLNSENGFFGVSSPSFLINAKKYKGLNNSTYASTIGEMPFLIMAGKRFPLSTSLVLNSYILMRLIGRQPFQFEVNNIIWFNNKLAAGVGYRSADAILGTLQLNVNNEFKVGYAYDYSVSKLGSFNQGSHELMLSYRIFKRINETSASKTEQIKE